MTAGKTQRSALHQRTPRSTGKRWSQHVTRTSSALDLDRDVFTWRDPRRVARSLKHSAETSSRRKGGIIPVRHVDA